MKFETRLKHRAEYLARNIRHGDGAIIGQGARVFLVIFA